MLPVIFIQRVNPVYVSTHMTRSPMFSQSESAGQARRLTTYDEMPGCALKLIIPAAAAMMSRKKTCPECLSSYYESATTVFEIVDWS